MSAKEVFEIIVNDLYSTYSNLTHEERSFFKLKLIKIHLRADLKPIEAFAFSNMYQRRQFLFEFAVKRARKVDYNFTCLFAVLYTFGFNLRFYYELLLLILNSIFAI